MTMEGNNFIKEEELNRKIDERAKRLLAGGAFTSRQLADTPTDALSVVNKRYVNLNGSVADRPKSSVASIGQSYLATDTKIPMTYDSTGWVNGVGSIVALNN